MDLYYSPLSCSMASKVALAELGVPARLIEVDRVKRTSDGADFREIAPLGQVPVLRTDDGELLFENVAILHHIAELAGKAGSPAQRAKLLQWLSFAATELHKGVFAPLFDPSLSADVKEAAKHKGASRFAVLEAHLASRDFVLDEFSVADAYLATVLNWAGFVGIDLAPWPKVVAYRDRILSRPLVAPIVAKDQVLFAEQMKQAA